MNNSGQAPEQLSGFEARLEAELVKVVRQRAQARQAASPRPGLDTAGGGDAWERRAWHRQPGWTERTAGRLLRSPGLARALVTTPSLLLGWIVATIIVLAAGILATLSTGTGYVALVAPAVAGAGIAYAYGPAIDPAWELSQSMAVSDRMVLLVRARAVFALNAVLGLAASAATGVALAVTFGWLVPMTAVCGLALATATVTRSANVGVAAGIAAWAITVLVARQAAGSLTAAVTDPALVPAYLAVAAAGCVAVLRATRIPKGFQ
jgi:hypothetical protein